MMGGPILVTFFVYTSYIFFFQSIYERVFNKCCLLFDPVVHQDCHMFSVVLNVTSQTNRRHNFFLSVHCGLILLNFPISFPHDQHKFVRSHS